VQNTSDFDDLGVATSGITFFRTIGSSFGAAVFGSLFTNFLAARIGPALVASGAPPEAARSPHALHALPRHVAAPIVHAYAESLDLVFLCAAPVAAGFILALFLKEVPLRDTDAARLDLGEGFGMPGTDSPEKLLEIAVGRMLRHGPPGVALRAFAEQPGCDVDIARLWALIQIYRNAQVFGSARLTDIAHRLRMPPEVLEPTFDRLVNGGYALRTGDQLWLSQSGARQVDFCSARIADWIVNKLDQSGDFDGRPDREQVEAALERIAHRVLAQRDWEEDRARLVAAGDSAG
jgi:hypothetical protein